MSDPAKELRLELLTKLDDDSRVKFERLLNGFDAKLAELSARLAKHDMVTDARLNNLGAEFEKLYGSQSKRVDVLSKRVDVLSEHIGLLDKQCDASDESIDETDKRINGRITVITEYVKALLEYHRRRYGERALKAADQRVAAFAEAAV